MYNTQLNQEQLDLLQRADRDQLIKALEKGNDNIIRDMKQPGCDIKFLQGASHITDRLLKVLKGSR